MKDGATYSNPMARKSFKQHTLALAGGHDFGPLFGELRKTRAPRRQFAQAHGRIRRQAERRAMPAWVDRTTVAAFHHASRAATKHTGIQHSVGHIVPLQHPLVCVCTFRQTCASSH